MSLMQMSFLGAVMILAIAVVRRLAMNRLPKKVFILLWYAVLLRLAVPFSVPSVFSAYSLVNVDEPLFDALAETPVGNVVLPAATAENALGPEAAPAEPEAGAAVSVWFSVWCVGAAGCAVFFVSAYLRCYLEFRTSLPVQCDSVSGWLERHPLRRAIKVRQSDRTATPLTYGIISPVILLPKDTEWDNEEQLQYILVHEYMHIRHWDMAGKLAAAAALCIHWFNPMVWLMYFLFNRDMELACDESVVRQFGVQARSAYAKTLIAMKEKESGFVPLYNSFSKNAIEERITAIMKTKKLTVGALLISAVVLAGVVALFATSAKKQDKQMLFVMGRLFVATQEDVSEAVAREAEISEYDSPYIGVIETTVDSSRIPDQELQSNFGSIGSEIIFHGSGIAVEIDGAWIQFETVESLELPGRTDIQDEEPEQSIGAEGDEGIAVPDVVLETAKQLVQQQFGYAEAGLYSSWRMESLAYVYTYEDFDGMTLQVYQLNYEFLAEDPESVVLVGGQTMDEEGWVIPGYANSHYLIFRQEEDTLSYLAYLSENDCFPGDEVFTGDLKNRLSSENSWDDGEIMVYVESFDGKVIAFDRVEWITFPSDRAAELGITDPGGGFEVLNEEVLIQQISVAEDCSYNVLDWTGNYVPIEVTGEELCSLLQEREGLSVPYRLTIKENKIVGIAEQYVP